MLFENRLLIICVTHAFQLWEHELPLWGPTVATHTCHGSSSCPDNPRKQVRSFFTSFLLVGLLISSDSAVNHLPFNQSTDYSNLNTFVELKEMQNCSLLERDAIVNNVGFLPPITYDCSTLEQD